MACTRVFSCSSSARGCAPVRVTAKTCSGHVLPRLHSASPAMRHNAARAQQKAVGIADEAKEFFSTLTDTLSAPKVSNFEPEALAKELTSTESLGSRGEVFFVAQIALFFLVLFPLVDLSILTRLGGFGAIALGGAMLVAGSNVLGKALTPLPEPRAGAELVTDGLYKHVRHPMYAGLALVGGGVAGASLDATRTLFAIALIALLWVKAGAEEERLVAKYGSKYEEYMTKVKRFGIF